MLLVAMGTHCSLTMAMGQYNRAMFSANFDTTAWQRDGPRGPRRHLLSKLAVTYTLRELGTLTDFDHFRHPPCGRLDGVQRG